MGSKFFVIVVAVVLLASSAGLVVSLAKSRAFSWSALPSLSGLGQKIDATLKSWFGSPVRFSQSGNGGTGRPGRESSPPAILDSESKAEIIVNVTLMPTGTEALRLRLTTKPSACYRYRITNADGSTRSNKCYSKAIYDQIWGAATDASSARTFVKFHEDGYNQYMELYRKDGKSLWLDAANSQKASMDIEQAKLSAALVRISALEAQGR